MTVSQMIFEAFRLMGAGVGSVFAVLGLFFILIKLMIWMFPDKNTEKK